MHGVAEASKDVVVSFWGSALEYCVHVEHGVDSNYRHQESQILPRCNMMVTVAHHIHCNSSAQTPVNSKLKGVMVHCNDSVFTSKVAMVNYLLMCICKNYKMQTVACPIHCNDLQPHFYFELKLAMTMSIYK